MMCSESVSRLDKWKLPDDVTELHDVPLYLAVAIWAMKKNVSVTVSDVQEAFAIPQRRASDIIHYILHEGARYVETDVCWVKRHGEDRRKAVRVRRVCMDASRQMRKVVNRTGLSSVKTARKANTSGRDPAFRQLRAWFATRRMGEIFPEGEG
ncbi:CaiF/GrlA family transcriptional regulator [Salmonella enterica subsp. enterica serovar Ball]|nr:CaiF/GrlA family transcriptional regulator [Salmonella enterica subsp. enterica serovar Ball]